MESKSKELLKKCSKDDESFKKLMDLFEVLQKERDMYENHLNLLEAAIRNDYDSILITELELEEPGPRIVYVNDGFTRMTGYSKEEVIGKTPRILQGPKTDKAVLKKLKERLQAGKSFFGQAVNYRKDGSEFVNQWDIHPLTDDEGNVTHWVSYQHDITERKRAEKVLVDTQIEFDRLREESRQTVIDVDLQGNIAMANKSFRELVGYSHDELKRIKVWDLFPQKFSKSLKKRFDEGQEDEQFGNQNFRGIVKHKNGIPIQIEGKTDLLKLEDQTLIRAHIKNITLQKRIMETIRKRNQDYRKIVEKASEYTYRLLLKEGEPVFEAVSEEFPVLTGISPRTLQKAEGYKKLVHPDDREKVLSHYHKVLEGKSCTCTYRVHTSDDGYVEIIDYAKPEWDSSHNSIVCIKGAVSLKPKNGNNG